MSKQTIYEICRNDDEKICFQMGEYKEKIYVDIRIFFKDKATGELKPTKKGITVLESLIGELKSGIIACEKKQRSLKSVQDGNSANSDD